MSAELKADRTYKRGATGAVRTRPDGDGRDLHPGLIGLPGSEFVCAVFPLRGPQHGTARVAPLPSPSHSRTPSQDLGRGIHRVIPPTVSVRETSRCFERGPFFSASVVARENLALTNRHEPGSQALRKGPKRLPMLVALHSQRMEHVHGEVVAVEYDN